MEIGSTNLAKSAITAAARPRPTNPRLSTNAEYYLHRHTYVLVLRACRIGLHIATRFFLDGDLLDKSALGWAEKSHRQQHEVGLDLGSRARPLDQLAFLPFDSDHLEFFYLAVLADKFVGRYRPIAFAPLFVRRRRAHLDRPVRPHQRFVLVLRGLRQQFKLRNRRRSLPIRSADAVGTRIATAYDDYMFAGSPYLVRNLVASHDLVLLRQEFDCAIY